MTEPVRMSSIALVGAGLIGRRHAEAITACGDVARVHAVIDPDAASQRFAGELAVPWFSDIAAMLAAGRPDGVIVATPNHLHVDQGLECIDKGIPTLVEKPIATDVAAARRLVEASERNGIALLVGHHRRHNPLVAAARQALASGRIGRIVTVHANFWVYKPDDYFTAEWRRGQGAGPVFINLIHDIDLLRHLCGEIVSVQAIQSNMVRKSANEDTAVAILRFATGTLGTINMSDTVAAPWSWEQTSRENPAYPPTSEFCYLIGGTGGSLEIPSLRFWTFGERKKSWLETLETNQLQFIPEDPLIRQIRHFCSVVRGERQPLVSGREGLATLEVIEAIKRSAETGEVIWLRGRGA
jgi:predicted dehydrogenase